jgi:hypothetical protein
VTQFPLIFDVKDTLSNDRFMVEVRTKGKVLASIEAGQVWLYGVNPGGLAGGGEDFDRAYVDFRTTFTNVLDDLVKEAQTVAEFEEMARAFLLETNEPTMAEWKVAVDATRSGDVNIPGMKREPADQEPEIVVHEKTAASDRPEPPGISGISVTPFALAKAA